MGDDAANGNGGIAFRETMKGGFALGVSDPHAGVEAGRKAGSELAMHATITIDDMDAFVADAQHAGHISGTIDFAPLGVGLVAGRGVFRLFSPSGSTGEKHMVYELAFKVGNEPHYLAGHKVVRKDGGLELWSDTTTLYTTLHRGEDRSGEVIGAGVLELTPVALMRLLGTVRAINTEDTAAKARAVAKFGKFFSRELFDTYVRTPGPAAPRAKPPADAERWDVIIVGSGFGGSVMACRLAQAGQRVLVLERGRRWDAAKLPRDPDHDSWWWDANCPEKLNGWVDLRVFDKVAVAQGAAVGGGSHIYANISVEAPPVAFASGWPEGVDYNALKPFYDRVGAFMDVAPVPANQLPERTRLMRAGARALGAEERFRQIGLAVSFDPECEWDGRSPIDRSKSVRFTNRHGVEQGTCHHCGMCDIGCEVKAKNTLDLNYLAVAEQHGCDIRPLHLVSHVEAHNGGYAVHFDRLQDGRRLPGVLQASRVVLAAGSLGSTELLLRSRDASRSLNRLSAQLGKGWCTNGDFLTPAFYDSLEPYPSRGPTITSAIDFLDGSRDGQRFWIQDGGVPDMLDAWLQRYVERKPRNAVDGLARAWVGAQLRRQAPLKNMMPWFAQGIDKSDGQFRLRRRWWLFGPRRLHLDWDITGSEPVINAIVNTHRELTESTGGRPQVPPTWTAARYLVTPHPLGGCAMADTPQQGVVDRKGEVFGHRGLYVIDGAMFPTAIGVNPSRTIAALAEFCAEQILAA